MNEDYGFLIKIVGDYQEEKLEKFSSHNFMSNVIRQLSCVYSEAVVVSCFSTANKNNIISSFSVYGYSKENIELFLKNLLVFYTEYILTKKYKKDSLIQDIEKNIIDMMICRMKKMLIDEENINLFEDTLYSPNSRSIPVKVYNFLLSTNGEAALDYWKKEKNNVHRISYLAQNLYEKYGFTFNEVLQLDEKSVLEINKIITKSEQDGGNVTGGRNESIINEKPKRLVLTSGNAIVDAILLMSFIATQLFVGLLVAIELLKR